MTSSTSTLSFNAAGRTLFTAEEARHLMRVEFDRARRYGYPLACFMVGIDRLESIQAVHGHDAGVTIVEAVLDLIRAETRASDFLACLFDDRVLAIFPHTEAGAAEALADRLLIGARAIGFETGDTRLRVTLSIGLSHSRRTDEISFETLVRVAEEGLAVADAGGGDRFAETELYDLYERQVRREVEERQAERRGSGGGERRRVNERAGARPGDRGGDVQARLEALVDGGANFEAAAISLAEEIVGRALRRLEAEREENGREALLEAEHRHELELRKSLEEQERRLAGQWRDEMDASRQKESELAGREEQYQREIDLLQRRVAKLTQSLDATEGELKRVANLKVVDGGVASIYREVQGLSSEDDQFEVKKELMGSIFQANLTLQKGA